MDRLEEIKKKVPQFTEFHDDADALPVLLVGDIDYLISEVERLCEMVEKEHDEFNPILDRYKKALEEIADDACGYEGGMVGSQWCIKNLERDDAWCQVCIATAALKGGDDG